MGELSSGGGIALVVPGYYVCAGILLYTAIVAAVPALHRGRRAMYLAFAATCVFSACVAFGIASYYLTDSVAGAVEAQRWVTSAGALVIASIFVFIAQYTDAPRMAPWYVAGAAAAAGFIAATFYLPHGTRFDSIDAFGYLHMPWGESLFYLVGEPGVLNRAFRGAALAVMAWSVWRLRDLARRGNRRDATVLAIYLVVLFGTSVQGALVDYGAMETFYWSPLALVGLALLMGVNLMVGLQAQNRALSAAVRADELTGLPNRRAVGERLRRRLVQGPPGRHGELLECDLDHFKVINDALGQEVGDALLREVAGRLRACAGERGFVARVGGNAFIILGDAWHGTEAAARAALQDLALEVGAALATPFDVGERSLGVTASVGVVTYEAGSGDVAEVVARANLAMELAKRRGRNNIQTFVPQMQEEASRRYRVVEGLRQAIERRELELHYQPIVSTDGRIAGAEALMRWHPPSGEVSPAQFIPVAEETGIIHSLGEWSLGEGCDRLAAWARAGVPFEGHLSVNVSPWQLARPDFVLRLQAIVAASGVDPHRLTLEITESAVLFDVEETVAKLREIRPLGVRIALDDFGTGYSSLALIKDLPIDAIKIDQSFVRQLDVRANQHLVRMVVAIGAELGLDIVAEGVETEDERALLLELGCTRLQGYLFARPLAEADFLRWMALVAPRGAAFGSAVRV